MQFAIRFAIVFSFFFGAGNQSKADNTFRPLFNGKDLSGWVNVNTAPSTWSIEDGLLICSGKPVGEIRTDRMYQNFILELEWRHMVPRGNAGVFIWADDITAKGQPFHRGIEVQVLENAFGKGDWFTTHGDIFPIHGAKMTPINGRGRSRAFPTEERSKPSPNWNHYRIECNEGNISLAVNGKVVTRGEDCTPSKGYICLESEGGIVHYRNIRIKELPDTPIADTQIAIKNRGYRCLYSGVDLTGWKTDGSNWSSRDWVLAYTGDGTQGSISTNEQFGDLGFIVDVRSKDSGSSITIDVRGAKIVVAPESLVKKKMLTKATDWVRIEGTLIGDKLIATANGHEFLDINADVKPNGPITIHATAPTDFANTYIREIR